MTDREKWFYERCAFSYTLGVERAEDLRRVIAKKLAQAEAWGKEVDLEVEWTDDLESEKERPFYGCIVRPRFPEVSSWGIDAKPDDEYRTFVEAELMLELAEQMGKEFE